MLLTRDGDENVPLDRRTSMANNNKADLFISLHANASRRPQRAGRAGAVAQPLQEYKVASGRRDSRRICRCRSSAAACARSTSSPWELAQLPFASRSAAVAAILVRLLAERSVPLYPRPAAQMPLRPLVGANMPAVLVEIGFLTNADDESAFTKADATGAIIDAIVAMVSEVRRGIPATGRRP